MTLSIDETFPMQAVEPDPTRAVAISARGRDGAALVRVALERGTEEALVAEPDEGIFEVMESGLMTGGSTRWSPMSSTAACSV
jgi:hypothetical protein